MVARFPDDEDEEMLAAYRAGGGVDCVGGAEAIISHLVTMFGLRLRVRIRVTVRVRVRAA